MVQTCLLRWCRRNTQEKGAEHWHLLCIIYEDINLLSINKSTQRVLVSLTGLSLMLQKKEDTPSSKYPRGWIRDLKTVLSWHTSAHTLPQITYLDQIHITVLVHELIFKIMFWTYQGNRRQSQLFPHPLCWPVWLWGGWFETKLPGEKEMALGEWRPLLPPPTPWTRATEAPPC